MNLGNWPELKLRNIIVRGTCNSTPVEIFVDTGATTSLVSSRLIYRLDMIENIIPTKSRIRGLDNKIVPMRGEIKLQLSFAGINVTRNFIVSDTIQNSFLIGMDIFNEIDANINVKNRTLTTLNGVETFIFKPLGLNRPKRIKCTKTIQLLPIHRPQKRK